MIHSSFLIAFVIGIWPNATPTTTTTGSFSWTNRRAEVIPHKSKLWCKTHRIVCWKFVRTWKKAIYESQTYFWLRSRSSLFNLLCIWCKCKSAEAVQNFYGIANVHIGLMPALFLPKQSNELGLAWTYFKRKHVMKNFLIGLGMTCFMLANCAQNPQNISETK